MTEETRQLRRLYWWSFAVRFGLGIVAWLLMQSVSIPLLDDALYYDTVGNGIAHDWLSGKSSTWLATTGQQPHQPVLMVTVIACFYVLTLGVPALPLLMAFYSALTAFMPAIVFRIARQIGASPSAALASGWLAALSPAFAFWCGALYKEGLVLLILSLAIYYALRLQAEWRARSFYILGLCLLGLCGLRLYLAAIVALTLCFGLFFGRERKGRPGLHTPVAMRQAVVALLLSVVVVAVACVAYVQDVLPEDFAHGFNQVQISRNDLASTPSGYLPDADVSTPQDVARFMPLGLAYFLTVPLPWQTGTLRQNLAIPDTALWLLLYPVILIGMTRAMRRNTQGSLLIIAISIGLCLFYAVWIANVGTAYRMRVQAWLLWAPFFGMGWEALRPQRHHETTSAHTLAP